MKCPECNRKPAAWSHKADDSVEMRYRAGHVWMTSPEPQRGGPIERPTTALNELMRRGLGSAVTGLKYPKGAKPIPPAAPDEEITASIRMERGQD